MTGGKMREACFESRADAEFVAARGKVLSVAIGIMLAG